MSKVQDSKKDVHDDMPEDSLDFATLQGAIMSRLLLDELTDGSGEKDDEKESGLTGSELTGFREVRNSLIEKLQAEMQGASHEEIIARIKLMDVPYGKVIANEDSSPFTDWLTGNREKPPMVNCWEAILLAAVKSGLTTRTKLAALLADETPSSEDLAMQALNYSSAAPLTTQDGVPTNVQTGDVLFFMGLAHVGVATDNRGGVAQVWGARKRQTTITEILTELKGTMSAADLRGAGMDENSGIPGTQLSPEVLEQTYTLDSPQAVLQHLVQNGFAEVRVAKPRWP